MRNILIYLSGADLGIVRQCPSERVRFGALGALVLLTGVTSGVLLAVGCDVALDVQPVLAVTVGIVWASLMLSLDRWLIGSLSIGNRRVVLAALPRIFLGLSLGLIYSAPLITQILRPEINTQIAVIQQQNVSTFQSQLGASPVSKEIDRLQIEIDGYEKVISSGGYTPLDPALDPTLQLLIKRRNHAEAQEHAYYDQWQCQLYGGPHCTAKGNGPLAQASEHGYYLAVAQVTKLDTQVNAQQEQLAASDAGSRRARLQVAKTLLPGAQAQLEADVHTRDSLKLAFNEDNSNSDGLMIRLQALDQLSSKNPTVSSAALLLFLLIAMIECLPVITKLMQRPGIYERVLALARDQELRIARSIYRKAVLQTRLEQVWDRESDATTPRPAGSANAPSNIELADQALRGMQDMRSTVLSDNVVVPRPAPDKR